jgi:hypothetical protein
VQPPRRSHPRGSIRKHSTRTSPPSFRKALDAQDATAPGEIADDVEADNEWSRTRKLELLEQFDYDLRRIMLEGSAEELAAWNYFDPAIVEQESQRRRIPGTGL